MFDLRRRDFITLLGAAAAWPLVARAQPRGRVRRIGFVAGANASLISSLYNGFVDGIRDLGYVDGKDFVIEWRFAEGNYKRFDDFASELTRLKVDVIVLATTAAIRPMQLATSTIPIVMGTPTDPVGNGFVASLARPGGNTTGLAVSAEDSAPKQLELITTILPSARRIGVLISRDTPSGIDILNRLRTTAGRVGANIIPVEINSADEIEPAFAMIAREDVQAIIGTPDARFFAERAQIAKLALASRLPSIFPQREYAEAGCLMSYGESFRELLYRAASFVDKIFKGAKPADLPIEQPTRFHLVINRKTADALNISIPSQLYIFADEVIE
jgi:putative ABC transport system substrate-binding protein